MKNLLIRLFSCIELKSFFCFLFLYFFYFAMYGKENVSIEALFAENFIQKVEKEELPVFIILTASWCSRCQRLESQIIDLVDEFKGNCLFKKIDIDLNNDFLQKLLQSILKKHSHFLSGFPSILVFFKGTFIDSFLGIYQEKEELKNKIHQLIFRFKN